MPDQQVSGPSFIPHGAPSVRRKSSGGALTIVSFLIFIISALLAGGVFFYTRYLEAKLESTKAAVAEAQASLDRSTAEELIRLSRRLNLSGELLDDHAAMTPFFAELEKITLPSVQFTSLDMATDDGLTMTLSGVAQSYAAIALQSDAFGGNQYFKNPVFSSFTPNDTGRVDFEVTFDVDPTLLSFDKTL